MTDGLHKISGCENSDRVADVVFVHGLDGDACKTWQVKDQPATFWPLWLGEDFPDIGIWSLDYAVSASAWKGYTMPLYDRANNTLHLLELDNLGQRPLAFVCHSLGGLLVKQMLRSARDSTNADWKRITDQTRLIVFLSTPHSGADMASWIKYLDTLLRTTVSVQELEAHHARLRELNTWYRDHAAELCISTFVYHENLPTCGILVVNQTTADPGIPGVRPIPLDENHVTICKPASKQTQVYRGVKRWIDKYLLNASTATDAGGASASEEPESDSTEGYPGTLKIKLCQRLGTDWQALADFFEIPSFEQARFVRGNEPREIWEWLERRQELPRLCDGLRHIDRVDLAGLLKKKDLSLEQARACYFEQLKTELDDHAGLYTPLSGDAARQRRRKPLPSAAPSLIQRIPRALPEHLQGRPQNTSEYADIITAFDDDLHQAVLIGEPGAGKTTALYRLVQQLLDQAAQNPAAPLPVRVPLGEWRDAKQPLREFIAAKSGPLAPFVPDLLSQHRLVLLLDGLNEIPTAQQSAKVPEIAKLIRDDQKRIIVSCREQDYRDHLKLDLDTLAIRPLTPSRILEFIQRYLLSVHDDKAQGREAVQALFWTMAGGDQVRLVWDAWQAAGAPDLDFFWSVDEIPRNNPDIYSNTSFQDDKLWRELVKNPRSLMRLASNPFMLHMMINIYWETEQLPANRASLFEIFIKVLLAREKLADKDSLEVLPEGVSLLQALGELAWRMQQGALDRNEDSVQVTLDREQVSKLLDSEPLKQAASASLLENGEQVRFGHQLLQEYFVALGMRTHIETAQLAATDLWPAEHWWQRSGWEEATILLAGLHAEDCTPIIDWLRDAQPEVAAQCINRSGANIPEATLQKLRDAWIPRLTDLERDPDPRARAAVGRALGSLSVNSQPLDNRPGVWGAYLPEKDRVVVDIDWVEIPGGKFLYQDGEQRELDTFWIARYPVTHSQFLQFMDDPQGYHNEIWWHGLAERSNASVEPRWTYHNHPHETVNWYEAIAFCRWLSVLRGEEITLPTEQEWERAACGRDGRDYPWGKDYRSGYANMGYVNIYETSNDVDELHLDQTSLDQTSAVGIYPQGQSVEGVLDLSGNVWEWCLNEYDNPERIDSTGTGRRVVRGGSWLNGRDRACAAFRFYLDPGLRYYFLGFRVVRRPPS